MRAVVGPEPESRPVRLLVPRPGPEVPVDPTGGLVIDADDPVLAALPSHLDLLPLQVQVAAAGIIRVAADPGQPYSRRPEHRKDRRVTALRERVGLARLLIRAST
jgi:hypothetical protein